MQTKIAVANTRARIAWCHQRKTSPWRSGWLAGFAAALCTLVGAVASAQETTLSSTVSPQTTSDDEEAVPMCHNGLRLSGAVYNARRPHRSFVVLQNQDGRLSAVYRAGGWIGAYQVVAIEPRGVLLRDDHGECWLQLRSEPGSKSAKAKPRPKKRKARKAPNKSTVTVIGGRSK